MGNLFEQRHADFSPCRAFRYTLSVVWDRARPWLCLCLLNPSTADEFVNDPTVARCCHRARDMGYGGLVVINAYAYRSTKPGALRTVADPIGPQNDEWITTTVRVVVLDGGMVICGWGRHVDEARPGRSAALLGMIRAAGAVPHALKLNADGSPQHPLYLPYDLQPGPMP